MSNNKKKATTTDLLVGLAAAVALVGIGVFLVVDGFEVAPSTVPTSAPTSGKRTDTIKPLPLIHFKQDTVYETDSSIMSQSKADRKKIKSEDSLNKLKP